MKYSKCGGEFDVKDLQNSSFSKSKIKPQESVIINELDKITKVMMLFH